MTYCFTADFRSLVVIDSSVLPNKEGRNGLAGQ